MAEILRHQYESTFSKPDEENSIEDLDIWFQLGREEERAKRIEKEEEKEGEGREEEEEEDEDVDDEEDVKEDVDTTPERDEDPSESLPELYDAPFNYMDIVDAIGHLSESSGPGPDGISAILLKKAKISIALMMQNIFQKSFENSDIPDILKMGYICPILKPNSIRNKAASWRPVSLTSHVMKIMERVVRNHIVNHL